MKPRKAESQKANNVPFFQPSGTSQHHSLGSLFGMSDRRQIMMADHMALPQVILVRP